MKALSLALPALLFAALAGSDAVAKNRTPAQSTASGGWSAAVSALLAQARVLSHDAGEACDATSPDSGHCLLKLLAGCSAETELCDLTETLRVTEFVLDVAVRSSGARCAETITTAADLRRLRRIRRGVDFSTGRAALITVPLARAWISEMTGCLEAVRAATAASSH